MQHNYIKCWPQKTGDMSVDISRQLASCIIHMFIVNQINSFVLGDKQVSVSSLNRHAVATREDVGTSKAQCLKVGLTSCSLTVCVT